MSFPLSFIDLPFKNPRNEQNKIGFGCCFHCLSELNLQNMESFFSGVSCVSE